MLDAKKLMLGVIGASLLCAAYADSKDAAQANASTVPVRYIFNRHLPDTSRLRKFDLSKCPKSVSFKSIAATGPSFGPKPGMEISKVKMLGSSPDPQSLIREVLIPGDELFVFRVDAEGAAKGRMIGPKFVYKCRSMGSFYARSAEQYEIDYSVVSNAPAVGATCNLKIFHLSEGPAGEIQRTPEPTAIFLKVVDDEKTYCELKK